MGKYLISGIKIEFNYCFDEFFKNRIDKYKISDNEDAPYIMNVTLHERIEQENHQEIYRIKNRVLCGDENTKYLYVFDSDFSEVKILYKYESDYSKIEIKLLKSIKNLPELEYVLTGMMFLNIAIKEGVVPLHASAISHDGYGILFSAPSGTGKSTHATLWKQLFSDVVFINDDKPLISFSDNMIMVSGSPWSGKTSLNENVMIPLKVIVFLKQSPTNFIEELSQTEKLTHLMRNMHRPTEEDLFDNLLERLNSLIKNIPMYILNCNISEEAVYTIYKKVIKGD